MPTDKDSLYKLNVLLKLKEKAFKNQSIFSGCEHTAVWLPSYMYDLNPVGLGMGQDKRG
jgi:hypothetical protein